VALGANGRRINSVPTLMPTVVIPPSGGAITVLLLGIDQRPDETYPARADAIAVARIDPERQRVALLSLPRDLIVNIPGFGYQRINAASVLGELNPQYTGGGVALTRATVSDFLGIPIDHVVHANFQGFIGAIDAIGGVHITVERELYDAQYPTMDYGYTVAHFLPGPQHMDGATALIYGRMRHMDSDFERIKRQQQVMVAALARVREQNPLAQIESVAALSTALRDYVTTDLPQERLLGLAWALRNLEPAQVERYAVDASMVSEYAVPGDPYAQIPIPGAIQSLAQRLVTGP
jgi:polyisoprenyl-teichoic acid--peptidoglycan teichoic acid transferase